MQKKCSLSFHLALEVSAEGVICLFSWGVSYIAGLYYVKKIPLIRSMTSSNNTYLNGCTVTLACPVCHLGYQVAEHILLTSLKQPFLLL